MGVEGIGSVDFLLLEMMEFVIKAWRNLQEV